MIGAKRCDNGERKVVAVNYLADNIPALGGNIEGIVEEIPITEVSARFLERPPLGLVDAPDRFILVTGDCVSNADRKDSDATVFDCLEHPLGITFDGLAFEHPHFPHDLFTFASYRAVNI